MSRRSVRARKPTERVKSSENEGEASKTQEKEEIFRKVKENLSTEDKIHIILHPPEYKTEKTSNRVSNLGKRKRTTKVKNPPAKKQKIESPEYSDDQEDMDVFDPSESDGSAEENGEVSSDEEARVLKKQKKNLTQRQKAMMSSNIDELPALPMAMEKKVLTEEAKIRKSEQARRRKRLAEKQAEEERRAVIEKLLNRSKGKKEEASDVHVMEKKEINLDTCTRYNQKLEKENIKTLLTFPVGEIPQFEGSRNAPPIPKPVLCSVEGCKNIKKYNCSKTKVPLCSLSCYRLVNKIQ